MATPFPFTIGQTLTAAQLNAVTTLPTTTKTASHTLVIADQGTRVIMNSASATTITVNTSIFGASDVVEIQNIGAGVCTLTAGTTTVSSAGPLAIPQHGGGRLVFSSASAATYFPTAVTAAASSGLVLVANPTTFTASSAVQANNVFTSTFTNYLVMFTFASSATNDIALTMRLRAASTDTTTNYYGGGIQSTQVGTLSQAGFNATTSADFGDVGGIATLMPITFGSPQAAARTTFFMENMEAGTGSGNRAYQVRSGFQDSATQFDGFSITPGSGTLTGSFAVYGYSVTV